MERRPHGANRDSMSRRILNWNTEELRTSAKSNRRGTRKHEKTIRQEKKESSRTEGWRPCVARKQEHPIELTLKEVGQ